MTRTAKILLAGGVAACAVAAILADRALADAASGPTTNDAYVAADFSTVAPKVSGLIDQVLVDDNETVHAGQEVAHIDDRDYKVAVEQAEAALAAARAQAADVAAALTRQVAVVAQADAMIGADKARQRFAAANAKRYHTLSAGGAGTLEQSQQTATDLDAATATLARDQAAADAARGETAVLEAHAKEAAAGILRAQAALDQAQLNLSYTRILAPVDGVVGARSLRVGNFVNPGTALLAVVPLDHAYLLANYQETQLTHVVPGQPARITVDAFPGQTLTGHVESLAPANGVAFSPLPPDNATGNFTKIVQRFPLKIRIDPGQPLAARLRVGMSAEVTVDTAGAQP